MLTVPKSWAEEREKIIRLSNNDRIKATVNPMLEEAWL
jgi:hypothetical protein